MANPKTRADMAALRGMQGLHGVYDLGIKVHG